MADHPDVPPNVMDMAMLTPEVRWLTRCLEGVLTPGDLRTDLSHVIAFVLRVVHTNPNVGVIDLQGLPDEGESCGQVRDAERRPWPDPRGHR